MKSHTGGNVLPRSGYINPPTGKVMWEEGACMIKKVKGGYKVVSEKSGKNLGGPYRTKAEAKKRLQQVEFFKRQK